MQALALQLLGEEVVEARPDRRYRAEQDDVVEGRGDGRREDVCAELKASKQPCLVVKP